ncbi:MAG: hypothetical protein HYY31_02470 [Chloroflexi bacterium]|nr:hypothetical protein [Chloroflexota bacterium]
MTGPEAHLHTVLETQGLARSLFKPGEASFIIPNAVSRERIIQAWSAEDAVLSDVSIDGSSLKSMGVPWVAFTTHRAAAGIDSKSWKERLARGQIRYAEVKGVRWEATGGSDWTMAIEGSMTTLRVVFRGALDEAMHQALEGLILQAETRAA